MQQASASASGGAGGFGYQGARGGSGASVTLTNAVSGTATFVVDLIEGAGGGAGGGTDTGVAGNGGNGTATVGTASSPYETSASSVEVQVSAVGGSGGTTESGTAGKAGTGTAALYVVATAGPADVIGVANASGGNGQSGRGGAASAISNVSSPGAASSTAFAQGWSGNTPGSVTAAATATGTESTGGSITAAAYADSLDGATGTTGGAAMATANSAAIGSVTTSATATDTGASGSATAHSTAASGATAAVDTVSASATSPDNIAGVTTQTQANVDGTWFGKPDAAANGYAAYGWAMGLPSRGWQAYLVNATAAPVIEAAFTASGSSIFGAGVLGASYSSTSSGTVTYVASNTDEYNLSGTNSFTLGLLSMSAFNKGFESLSFGVTDGTATVLPTKTFTSLTGAEQYFHDDPVSLGNLTGPTDLTLTYKLTANAPEGAGISYVLAEAPAAAASKTAELTSILARINASYGAAGNLALSRVTPTAVPLRPAELVKELLAKPRH